MNIVRIIYRALIPYSARMVVEKTRFRATISIQKLRLRLIRGSVRKRQRHYEGKAVAVVGMFRTRSGIGRGAELIARSMEMQGFAVTRVDIPRINVEIIDNTAVSAAECEKLGGIISELIVVANPPIFFQALSMFSIKWLRRQTIVAHWVWELDVTDRDWQDAVKICDEIWASSEFVAQTLKPICDTQSVLLKVVPYAVDIDPFPPVEMERRIKARRKFDIPDGAFVVGYSFAASSNLPRKNPMGPSPPFKKHSRQRKMSF